MEFRGATDIHRAVADVNALRRQLRKIFKETIADRNGLVRLPTDAGHPTGQSHIGTVTIRAAERVAGQLTSGNPGGRHDHAAIQAARE